MLTEELRRCRLYTKRYGAANTSTRPTSTRPTRTFTAGAVVRRVLPRRRQQSEHMLHVWRPGLDQNEHRLRLLDTWMQPPDRGGVLLPTLEF